MAAPATDYKDTDMKKLHIENGLALLVAFTFLAFVSTATTVAVAHGYALEFEASASTH